VGHVHAPNRHALDPRLAGLIQHHWKRGPRNTEPGLMWRVFYRTWAPGFEALSEEGMTRQWYSFDNITDRYVPMLLYRPTLRLNGISKRNVFCWVAIPWVQKQANSYVYDCNTTRRMNRQKIPPNSIPDVMFEHPEAVNAPDFIVLPAL
jgi:hypothetical protein